MIPPAGLAAISAAVLAYEVLLVRLFAIVQWHHFAFMAISVALLGFGVSGAMIVVFRARVERHLSALFPLAAALFALTAPIAFLIAQRVPFNALEVVWAPSQLLYLGLIYLALIVPFTAGAACIGLAFRAPGAAPGRVYLWNLLGSAAGALGIVAALSVVPPAAGLALVAGLGLGAALIAGAAQRARSRIVALALLGGIGALGWWAAPGEWTALRISEFKGLTRALATADARLAGERSGPLALLSVVESPTVPFRHAPGLSLTAPALPPPQLGIFADGAFAGTIDLWDRDRASLAYLRHSTDALGYRLGDPRAVLVLNSGGGRAVLQALAHGADRIDAVEENADMLALVARDFAARAGRPYALPEVRTALAGPRRHLAAAERRWDLIQLPAIAGGGSAPARGLSEDFLLTAEGLATAYRRLRPGGWLSATVAIDLPPRAGLKLVATLSAALAEAGAGDPARHLIAIRGMTTLTVLARRGPVAEPEIAATKAFASEHGFDLVHYPSMVRAQANRRTRLAEPAFFDGVSALLGPSRAEFVAGYSFDIATTTDDRPYFHDLFKWAALPRLVALGSSGGAAALIELGEPIVTATLVQALVLGAALVLLPLRTGFARSTRRATTWRFGLYFTALGLAFLFVEIAWIQRFILFLGHPLYSVSVVLTGFLLFAGLGAGASAALDRRLARHGVSAAAVAVTGIVAIALAYHVALPPVFAALAGLPDAVRVLVALALIAPLAVFMGMPFPLGLARVAARHPDFVPWAWGLNGCASVVSTAAATLISMQAGISTTVFAAMGLYLGAAVVLPPSAGPQAER